MVTRLKIIRHYLFGTDIIKFSYKKKLEKKKKNAINSIINL